MTDFTRRIPCLLCDWAFVFTTDNVPQSEVERLRAYARQMGLEHYIRVHGGVRNIVREK